MASRLSIFVLIFIACCNAFALQQSDINDPEVYILSKKNVSDLGLVIEKAKSFKKKGLPVVADNWMVVTANFQASSVAAKILNQGGTAVDAMVAAQAVLGLVEPESSGLGGGAFLLYYNSRTKKLTSLDGRETAPLHATSTMFLDKNGDVIKFIDAVVGARSVGVPGIPALLENAHIRWGKLEWPSLFKDAIGLADSGFLVSQKLSSSVKKQSDSIKKIKRTRDYFFSDNQPIEAGQLLQNKAYADTLRKISKYGSSIFYSGEIADDIVSTIENDDINPGFLSKKDLLLYEVKERKPICSFYHDHEVCGMGPPSSGALTINQILGMIENFPISDLGPSNPKTWRIIGDASRLAFADRALYMADSDFVFVPVQELLNKKYLNDRSKNLNTEKKIPIVRPGKLDTENSSSFSVDMSAELPSTSHISIVDMYGNVLSMTTSIENVFGSRLMTKSGFLLNNELTDFSFKDKSNGKLVANRVAPRKRPRSSMSPTIIFHNNQPIYALGSPGGSNIIGYVLNAIIALIDWNMNAQQASSIPHAINKFGVFDIEVNREIKGIKNSLEEMGYEVNLKKFFSGLNIIAIKDHLYGGSDPRREGYAIGK